MPELPIEHNDQSNAECRAASVVGLKDSAVITAIKEATGLESRSYARQSGSSPYVLSADQRRREKRPLGSRVFTV